MLHCTHLSVPTYSSWHQSTDMSHCTHFSIPTHASWHQSLYLPPIPLENFPLQYNIHQLHLNFDYYFLPFYQPDLELFVLFFRASTFPILCLPLQSRSCKDTYNCLFVENLLLFQLNVLAGLKENFFLLSQNRYG